MLRGGDVRRLGIVGGFSSYRTYRLIESSARGRTVTRLPDYQITRLPGAHGFAAFSSTRQPTPDFSLGGRGRPSKRRIGGARCFGHLVTAWGFDPPVFFRCWKLTPWGPRVLGPPQLGVVADGNTTLGRSPSFSLVLERKRLPTSACAVPPPRGGVRVHGGFLLLPGGGVYPWTAELRE